jgi:hypothetical protein
MMRPSAGAIVVLATIATLACSTVDAEPRGATATRKAPAKETPEPRKIQPRRGYMPPVSRNELLVVQRDRALEVEFDEATRAIRLAELKTWIKRVPGRFRIEGHVEKMGRGGLIKGKVSGVADCSSVGEGAGAQCIFNAAWPVIDMPDLPFDSLMSGAIRRPPPSEAIRSFRPALLALGLDPALSEVRAMMVTDDSIAHTWAGRLTANTVKANRLTGCREVQLPDPPDFRCFQPLELVAEPESDIVTIVMRTAGVTLRLTLRRDPEARAKRPMKVR